MVSRRVIKHLDLVSEQPDESIGLMLVKTAASNHCLGIGRGPLTMPVGAPHQSNV